MLPSKPPSSGTRFKAAAYNMRFLCCESFRISLSVSLSSAQAEHAVAAVAVCARAAFITS